MRKGLVVEARAIKDLRHGSFEDLIADMDRSVFESSQFGDNPVLFSTHSDHIVVLNEDGIFFSAKYGVKDEKILLSNVQQIEINVMTEDELVNNGIDKFYDSSSLLQNLRMLVDMRLDESVDRARGDLNVLFSHGEIWRKYVRENEDQIGAYAWDAGLGSLDLGVSQKFEDICGGEVADDDLESRREEVLDSLVGLESRLHRRYLKAKEAFEEFHRSTDMRDPEADEVLSRFEAFAENYLDHLLEMSNYASKAVVEGRDGCVVCSAMIHDSFAKHFRDIELGGRFVQKVSSEFAA